MDEEKIIIDNKKYPSLSDYIFEDILCKKSKNLYWGQIYNEKTSFDKPVEIINGVKDCSELLVHCHNFNQPITIPESVCNATEMFRECIRFNQPIIIPNTIEKCDEIFQGCHNLDPNNITFPLDKYFEIISGLGTYPYKDRINLVCGNNRKTIERYYYPPNVNAEIGTKLIILFKEEFKGIMVNLGDLKKNMGSYEISEDKFALFTLASL